LLNCAWQNYNRSMFVCGKCERKEERVFYECNMNAYKGQQRQRYQSNGSPTPNSVPPTVTSCTFPALCPPLFTTLKYDRVNYGEAGFHKFRDEIWSDKFNSQDPAPWSRRAQVTRVDAHKYVCSRTRILRST